MINMMSYTYIHIHIMRVYAYKMYEDQLEP